MQNSKYAPAAETLPGYEASSWVGMMAPAGLPKDVSLKIQAAMKKALDTPEVKNRLTSEGFQIIGSTPEAFLETVRPSRTPWAN